MIYNIDEIENLCYWQNNETGKPVDTEVRLDKEFTDKHGWICNEETLNKLLDTDSDSVVVIGMPTNIETFMNKFDKVILLQCEPDIFINRIINRTNNNFGKEKTQQETLKNSYKNFEDKLLQKGAIPIGNKEYWNKGVATEVIKKIIDFAFNDLGIEYIGAEVEEGNFGIQKVIKKCGFIQDGLFKGARIKDDRRIDVLHFSILK